MIYSWCTFLDRYNAYFLPTPGNGEVPVLGKLPYWTSIYTSLHFMKNLFRLILCHTLKVADVDKIKRYKYGKNNEPHEQPQH
jgi:hypothetical protein